MDLFCTTQDFKISHMISLLKRLYAKEYKTKEDLHFKMCKAAKEFEG